MPAQPGSYILECRGVQLIEKKADTAGIASNTGCWLLLGPISTGFHYHFQRFQCPFNSSAFVDAKAPKIPTSTPNVQLPMLYVASLPFWQHLVKHVKHLHLRHSLWIWYRQDLTHLPFFPPPSLRCELLWRHVPPSKHDPSEGIVPHLYQFINISMKFESLESLTYKYIKSISRYIQAHQNEQK